MSSATCLSSEFKPGKSPVRLNSGALEFIVRSPFVKSSVDFTSFYALRSLSAKGNKRELVIAKSHAYIGVAGATSNLAEMGELFCGGAFESVLFVCQRLGRKEDSAAPDASPEAEGLRLAAVE